MKVAQTLEDKITDFFTVYNRRPNWIFLDLDSWIDLRHEVYGIRLQMKQTTNSELDPCKYAGIPIAIVVYPRPTTIIIVGA